MKKIIIVLAGLCVMAFAGAVQAQMDQTVLSVAVPMATTNTTTGVVKGEIQSIRLDGTATKTQAVTIVTAEGETLLSVAALTSDATYYPMVAAHKASDGSVIADTRTATDTNSVWRTPAVASVLTMTVIGAADTTLTNTTRAIITFKK